MACAWIGVGRRRSRVPANARSSGSASPSEAKETVLAGPDVVEGSVKEDWMAVEAEPEAVLKKNSFCDPRQDEDGAPAPDTRPGCGRRTDAVVGGGCPCETAQPPDAANRSWRVPGGTRDVTC